ncbi:MAG TPA: hypothetical protein VNH19_05715 [Candidatus Limnocylindrales bacterium]|nr:hypothetical protein [Candidatus Limnocylindrales bacterium]
MAFCIPNVQQIKAMADDELQKFLDSLKADEMTALDYIKALLESKKVVITLEPKQ